MYIINFCSKLTKKRIKHLRLLIKSLFSSQLLFQDMALAGSGASWHSTLPVCAVACNKVIKVYDLGSLTQS